MGFIITAIGAIISWFVGAATAAAEAIAIVVSAIANTLGWLLPRLANIVGSTWGMFAKVWDVTKQLWFNVLRPMLQTLACWYQAARQWLKAKLAPVFDLLTTVRQHIRDIYKHWIRPLLQGIDISRGVLSVLAKLHIPFAAALDQYLTELEGAIVTNYQRLLTAVNTATNQLNAVVTGDWLYETFPFLRAWQRDLPQALTIWWNAQIIQQPPGLIDQLHARTIDPIDPAMLRQNLGEFYKTGGGELAPLITELIPLYRNTAGI